MSKLISQKLLINSRYLRKNMTPAEQKIWLQLRQKQLGVKFRRQFPISFYILDFYSIEKKLAIEIDGDTHGEDSKKYDLNRTIYLNKHGIKVLRFTNSDVLHNLSSVMEVIQSNL